MHHPHRVPEVGGVRGPGRAGVPQPPGRAAHPLQAEVGVLGAQRAGPCQRGVGQRVQRQRQKGLVRGMG